VEPVKEAALERVSSFSKKTRATLGKASPLIESGADAAMERAASFGKKSRATLSKATPYIESGANAARSGIQRAASFGRRRERRMPETPEGTVPNHPNIPTIPIAAIQTLSAIPTVPADVPLAPAAAGLPPPPAGLWSGYESQSCVSMMNEPAGDELPKRRESRLHRRKQPPPQQPPPPPPPLPLAESRGVSQQEADTVELELAAQQVARALQLDGSKPIDGLASEPAAARPSKEQPHAPKPHPAPRQEAKRKQHSGRAVEEVRKRPSMEEAVAESDVVASAHLVSPVAQRRGAAAEDVAAAVSVLRRASLEPVVLSQLRQAWDEVDVLQGDGPASGERLPEVLVALCHLCYRLGDEQRPASNARL